MWILALPLVLPRTGQPTSATNPTAWEVWYSIHGLHESHRRLPLPRHATARSLGMLLAVQQRARARLFSPIPITVSCTPDQQARAPDSAPMRIQARQGTMWGGAGVVAVCASAQLRRGGRPCPGGQP